MPWYACRVCRAARQNAGEIGDRADQHCEIKRPGGASLRFALAAAKPSWLPAQLSAALRRYRPAASRMDGCRDDHAQERPVGQARCREWLGLRLARGPSQAAATEQVEVEVEDALAGVGADVEHGAEAVGQTALAGEVGGFELELAYQGCVLGGGVRQIFQVALGDQQDVRRRAGLDVLEGEDALIFVDLAGGNLALDDAAEQAVSHTTPVYAFAFRRLGSWRTGKFTDPAMKQSAWARSWSDCARAGSLLAAMVTAGRRTTSRKLPPPSAFSSMRPSA